MQTSSGRWVNLPRPLPRQPWPTTSLGDCEESREGVVESSEVALLQQAAASLQRAMSVLVEDTAASQVQAAAMEEAPQVQLAAVEAGAEASRVTVQVQRAVSVLVKEKAAAQVQAAAMAEEAQVQLVEVEARVEAEKRRADIATRVTKASREKSIAGSALKRCRRGSTLQEQRKCKSAYKDASKNFTRVKA